MKVFNNVNVNKILNSNDSMGIEIKDNLININVPCTFRIETNEKLLKSDLIKFLRSIDIAKTINRSGTQNNKNKGDCWPIESYLWIIKDYLENGIYYNREKQFSNNKSGKIDWKRTLRTKPIVSNGNVIYNNLITTKMIATNDVISYTYQFCLNKSSKRIGWLYNFNFHTEIKPLYSIAEMKHFVLDELSKTFDDVKRMRFNHMVLILNSIDEKIITSNNFNYFIDNYYYVFEKMVDKFFDGIKGEEKKKYNPSGYWKILNHNETLASNLHPDTIYKRDGKTYILDAKMYSYGYTHDNSDLPDTSSMQKQITYGDYVAYKVDIESKVRNTFIIPYDKKLNDFSDDNFIKIYKDDLVYIGEAFVDWRNKKNQKDHERLFTFMIDFNTLLRSYFSYENNNGSIDKLCNQIELLLRKE